MKETFAWHICIVNQKEKPCQEATISSSAQWFAAVNTPRDRARRCVNLLLEWKRALFFSEQPKTSRTLKLAPMFFYKLDDPRCSLHLSLDAFIWQHFRKILS